MKTWFETRKEASAAQKEMNENSFPNVHVFKWKLTKRKKPFFVGTELDWLNVD